MNTGARPRSAAERGFTLVELAVSTLVLLLVLILAHGLLVESLRILRASAIRSRRPDDRIALRLLRADARAAAPAWLGAGWTSRPLDLPSAVATARWELAGDRLVRRRFDLEGEELGARAMLDEIVWFRWRSPLPGLLEIEIVRRIDPGSPELRASTAQWARSAETLETARVVVASRRGARW